MQIATFRQTPREVHSAQELLAAMKYRHESAYGCFWLWHDENVRLAIMINAQQAYVHFFPGGGHPGWQSYAREGREEIMFLADNYEATPMDREYTISTASAEQAAVEFLNTAKRPTCVKWIEL